MINYATSKQFYESLRQLIPEIPESAISIDIHVDAESDPLITVTMYAADCRSEIIERKFLVTEIEDQSS